MPLNFRGRKRHRASNIFNLQPREAPKIVSLKQRIGWLKFRNYAERALFNYLWNELVRVKQSTTNRDEQGAGTNAPRIVADVRDHRVLVAG